MLGHAAYSAVQREWGLRKLYCQISTPPTPPLDRSFLRLAEEEYTGVPNDVSGERVGRLKGLTGTAVCSKPVPLVVLFWCRFC